MPCHPRLIMLTGLALLAGLGSAPLRADEAAPAPPDYAQAQTWACRPEAEGACTAGLDAVVLAADGTTTPQPFVPAADPPIDCFYVYPTVSRERQAYSDLAVEPALRRTVRGQAGRLASRCRLFAPLYRQATLAHLHERMTGGSVPTSDVPYLDIAAAWAFYLAHDNHGRGVVLVGHSQGTILLQRLIAERIDGTPAQAMLVAAFLAGDPSLAVPPGRRVGGTFQHVPVCGDARETGCVYPWGSYLDGDASDARAFGKPRADGLTSACTDPAAPAGGSGPLKSYLPASAIGVATDAPWVELVGQLAAACRTDGQGAALRVTILPGRQEDRLRAMLSRAARRPGWGLHRDDIALYQGNILDLIDAETATWRRTHS